MVKNKIGKKLFITYLFLLIITFIIITISFNFLSYRYLRNETKQQLGKESQLIAEILKDTALVDLGSQNIQEKILNRRALKVAGSYIDSSILIINKENKAVFSNLDLKTREEFLWALQNDQKLKTDNLVEKTPIAGRNGKTKGYLFLVAPVDNIHVFYKLMAQIQLLSFVVAGGFAVIIAALFGRKLTNPINKLTLKMRNFSIKNYDDKFEIKTNDEIEELAISFSEMAEKLKNYDKKQKMFLQDASHELKTPLMSIQGYAEAIRDGIVLGEEKDEGLAIIIEESQRLKKIVEEIIYLTKLDNIQDNFNFSEQEVGPIFNRAIRSVKSLADEKGITIDLRCNLSTLGFFDKEKLTRVFINILSNSIRYAKSTVTIAVSSSNHKLLITITDDGKGIPIGAENKIFERFYKTDNPGGGIGLAISKAIIEGHQGIINACNLENAGAVFKIVLPLSQSGEGASM